MVSESLSFPDSPYRYVRRLKLFATRNQGDVFVDVENLENEFWSVFSRITEKGK